MPVQGRKEVRKARWKRRRRRMWRKKKKKKGEEKGCSGGKYETGLVLINK